MGTAGIRYYPESVVLMNSCCLVNAIREYERQNTIQTVLDDELPRTDIPDIYNQKCDVVYQHFYDSYYGLGKSVYSSVS